MKAIIQSLKNNSRNIFKFKNNYLDYKFQKFSSSLKCNDELSNSAFRKNSTVTCSSFPGNNLLGHNQQEFYKFQNFNFSVFRTESEVKYGKYQEMHEKIELNYKLIAEEKERLMEISKTKDLFNPKKDYSLNLRLISHNKVISADERLKFLREIPKYQTQFNEEQLRIQMIQIYELKERAQFTEDLMKKIISTNKSKNIYIHGNAGFGKTHMLIDLVARLRIKFLIDYEKHNKIENIIFYKMFYEKEEKEKSHVISELYFACYPIIKYERDNLKKERDSFRDPIESLTELEMMFADWIFQCDLSYNKEIYWEKLNEIILYLSKKYFIRIICVFDQINEIHKKNNLDNTNSFSEDECKKFINQFENTNMSSVIKCASNNNKIMRDALLDKISEKQDEKIGITIETNKFVYDKTLIKTKLEEKGYTGIESKFVNTFIDLTNGIPLLVDKMPTWEKGLRDYINKYPQINISDINTGKDKNKVVEFIIDNLKKEIEDYLVGKITKFKNEYYEKFKPEEKEKFKEILLNTNYITKKLDFREIAKFIDYQLLDYEIMKTTGKVKIKSVFPDIYRLYKDQLNIHFTGKEEKDIAITSFLQNLIVGNHSKAGISFEEALNFHFIEKNTFDPIKLENFNLYENPACLSHICFNAITKEDMRNNDELTDENLSFHHLLKAPNNITPKILFQKVQANLFFINKYFATPIIDGGFIYRPELKGKTLKIITFDAAIGNKSFENFDFLVNRDEIQNILEAERLRKIVGKLKEILPRTLMNFILSDPIVSLLERKELKIEFEKHLFIYPDLTKFYQNLEICNQDLYKKEIDSFKIYEERKNGFIKELCNKIKKSQTENVEIGLLEITSDINSYEKEITNYQTNLRKLDF